MSQSSKSSSKSIQTTGLSGYQKDIAETIGKVYAPYLGEGTLGGLSDLEEKALGMLKSSDIWTPLTTAGTSLLTGEMGAKEITPEQGLKAYSETVEKPYWDWWNREGRNQLAEEYSGPSFLSRGKQLIGEQMGKAGQSLAEGRRQWMWDVEQANRAIQESKAGRALGALGTVPGALAGWANALFGTGGVAREVANRITDPEVLQTVFNLLGIQTQPIITKGSQTYTPSTAEQVGNWSGALALGTMGLGNLGMLGTGGATTLSPANTYYGSNAGMTWGNPYMGGF